MSLAAVSQLVNGATAFVEFESTNKVAARRDSVLAINRDRLSDENLIGRV
jgi:hypothetical protein